MTHYNWRVVRWSKYDNEDPGDIIEQEVADGWDYYDAIQIHGGRLELVFRRTGN